MGHLGHGTGPGGGLECDPDGPRTGVGAHHRTQLAHDDLISGVMGAQQAAQRVDVGRVAVEDGQVLDAPVGADLVGQPLQ